MTDIKTIDPKIEQKLSPLGQLLHKNDKDRFITVMMLGADLREDVFAIYNFAYEIAKIRGAVSETMLGQMRLQWWRDAVEECIAGEPRRHEITRPLAETLSRHKFDHDLFRQMIDAREADLDDIPVQTLSELMDYANKTGGHSLRLGLQACGCIDADALSVAGRIGTAWALIGLMRALPFHLRAKKQWLPEELVNRHNIDGRHMRELNPSDELNNAVKEICLIVDDLIWEARQNKKAVAKQYRPLLQLAGLAESYRIQLEQAHFNPYDPIMASPSGLRMVKLLWRGLLGRF